MNSISTKHRRIDDIIQIIIYFTFAMYIGAQTFNHTLLELGEMSITLLKIRYICYFVFSAKILYDVIKGDKIPLSVVIIFVVSMLVYINTNNTRLILLCLVLVAVRKCNIKELIKIVFLIQAVVYIVIIFLSLIGIIPDWIYSRESEIRHSLGFTYPTIAIGSYLMVTLMYCYIRNSRITYLELVILQAINIFLYIYTKGRLGFILTTLTLLIMLMFRVFRFKEQKMKNILNKKSIKNLCCTFPVILLIATLLFSYLWAMGNDFAIYLNDILSGRFRFNYYALDRYEINLFGTEIKWNRLGWIWIYSRRGR